MAVAVVAVVAGVAVVAVVVAVVAVVAVAAVVATVVVVVPKQHGAFPCSTVPPRAQLQDRHPMRNHVPQVGLAIAQRTSATISGAEAEQGHSGSTSHPSQDVQPWVHELQVGWSQSGCELQ